MNGGIQHTQDHEDQILSFAFDDANAPPRESVAQLMRSCAACTAYAYQTLAELPLLAAAAGSGTADPRTTGDGATGATQCEAQCDRLEEVLASIAGEVEPHRHAPATPARATQPGPAERLSNWISTATERWRLSLAITFAGATVGVAAMALLLWLPGPTPAPLWEPPLMTAITEDSAATQLHDALAGRTSGLGFAGDTEPSSFWVGYALALLGDIRAADIATPGEPPREPHEAETSSPRSHENTDAAVLAQSAARLSRVVAAVFNDPSRTGPGAPGASAKTDAPAQQQVANCTSYADPNAVDTCQLGAFAFRLSRVLDAPSQENGGLSSTALDAIQTAGGKRLLAHAKTVLGSYDGLPPSPPIASALNTIEHSLAGKDIATEQLSQAWVSVIRALLSDG